MAWRATTAGAMAALLAGCGGPAPSSVDHGWVRLAAVPGRPAAGYFTLHGGPRQATLINVTSDVAVRAEMHETMRAGANMATMTPITSVPVPALTDVAFAPGGRHVMLFDVNPGIKPGATMTLTLSFADGSRLRAAADVVAAGSPAPQ